MAQQKIRIPKEFKNPPDKELAVIDVTIRWVDHKYQVYIDVNMGEEKFVAESQFLNVAFKEAQNAFNEVFRNAKQQRATD